LALAGAGLLPLLAVAIPASAVSLLLTIPLVIGDLSLVPSFQLGRWWRLLRETIPWAVISAVNIVYFRVTIVLMSLIATGVQTGFFATSFRITEVLVGVPGLVISAAFPILARAERDDAARFSFASGRLIELAVIAGTWMVMCLEVGAGFAIHLIAANKADPSIAVLRIQGLAVLATFGSVACGYPLLTLRRYKAVLYINLGALAASAVLTLVLVPSAGARGAAIAAALAETGLAACESIVLITINRELRRAFLTLPVALLAGGVGVGVGLALPIHPVLGAVVATLAFGAVLRLFGRFPPEARELMSGWLRAASGRESR
jgi:O-antigen/teichoic acid export membrane protein